MLREVRRRERITSPTALKSRDQREAVFASGFRPFEVEKRNSLRCLFLLVKRFDRSEGAIAMLVERERIREGSVAVVHRL
jgi:hypothetical protein